MTQGNEQPVPMEQVLAQLQTRGFETGGFRTPLRYFKGKLTGISGSMVKRGNMQESKLEVLYNFDELEVFASTEPYILTVAQIGIMHNNRVKSNMGVLGVSIDKIINAGLDDKEPQEKAKNQDFLIGKVQEWRMTPGHMMWDMQKGEETARECWEVVYIEGVGGTPHSGVAPAPEAAQAPAVPPVAASTKTPHRVAMELLNGKTQQDWNNIVFQNPAVKADADLTNSIISGTFIPPLEAAGLATKDATTGIYTVKLD